MNRFEEQLMATTSARGGDSVNMCNCNFEKTAADLLECYKHMADEMPESKETAKRILIRLCRQVSEEFGES